MKQVILTRISEDAKQTLGTLSVAKDNGQVFTCKTLELSPGSCLHEPETRMFVTEPEPTRSLSRHG